MTHYLINSQTAFTFHPTPQRADGEHKISKTQVRYDLYTLCQLGCRVGLSTAFLSEISRPGNASQQRTIRFISMPTKLLTEMTLLLVCTVALGKDLVILDYRAFL